MLHKVSLLRMLERSEENFEASKVYRSIYSLLYFGEDAAVDVSRV